MSKLLLGALGALLWATMAAAQVPQATIATLRAWVPTGAYSRVVHLDGYTTPGDGGGGNWIWSTTSTAADDGCGTIKPSAESGAGRWLRVIPAAGIDVRSCGAQITGAPGAPTADTAGQFDNTAALNAACALGVPVRLPAGQFHITSEVACSNTKFTGAGGLNEETVLTVGSDANLGVSCYLNLAPTAGQLGTQAQDLAINFYQTPTLSAPSTANISGSALTVVSGATPTAGEMVASQYTNPATVLSGSGPFTMSKGAGGTYNGVVVTYWPTFTGSISGNTLTVTSGSVAIGDMLAGDGVLSGQFIVSGSGSTWTVSRTQGVVVPNETIGLIAGLRQYAPAICGTQPANRPTLANVNIENAITGLSVLVNEAWTLTGKINIGAYGVPFIVDGPEDYFTAQDIELWNFGSQANTTSMPMWLQSPQAELGYCDGCHIRTLVAYRQGLRLNPNSSFDTSDTIGDLQLDDAGTLDIEHGTLTVGALNVEVSNGPTIVMNGLADPFHARLNVGVAKIITDSLTGDIVNHGGYLTIGSGQIVMYASSYTSPTAEPLVMTDANTAASVTQINNVTYDMAGGATLTQPIVVQSGNGSIVMHNWSPESVWGATGVALIQIGNDIVNNYISNVFLNNESGVTPVSIVMNLSAVRGYYDFPDVNFPVTITPAFATPGNSVLNNNSNAGYYRLLGNMVQFVISDNFMITQTTASGALQLTTNMPGFNPDGGYPLALPMSLSGPTFPAGEVPFAQTNSQSSMLLMPMLNVSGGSPVTFTTSNIPSGVQEAITISGEYPVR